MADEFGNRDDWEERIEGQRGRPRIPDEEKRSEKLVLSFTKDEMRRLIIAGANAAGGPLDVKEWARTLLIEKIKEP